MPTSPTRRYGDAACRPPPSTLAAYFDRPFSLRAALGSCLIESMDRFSVPPVQGSVVGANPLGLQTAWPERWKFVTTQGAPAGRLSP